MVACYFRQYLMVEGEMTNLEKDFLDAMKVAHEAIKKLPSTIRIDGSCRKNPNVFIARSECSCVKCTRQTMPSYAFATSAMPQTYAKPISRSVLEEYKAQFSEEECS